MALRFAPIALAAGALVLAASAASAAAQVKITGKEVMISNQSAHPSPLVDLPSPPKIGMAPAAGPKAGGPSQYCNSFTCIPDSAAAPAEKITIHGQYDLRSAAPAKPRTQNFVAPDPTALYDFPGGYAQRFDGIGPGGAKPPASNAHLRTGRSLQTPAAPRSVIAVTARRRGGA